MKNKKLILTCTSLSILTSTAFASQSARTQAMTYSLQGAANENWALLGVPTLYATEMPTSSTICVNTIGNTSLGTSPQVSLNFSTTASDLSISHALNLGAGGSGNISKIATVGANSLFAASIEDTDYSYNLTYLYTYSTKASVKTGYGISNLNSDGQAALTAGNAAFFQTCGDSFVSNLDAGVVLAVNVGIKFKSKQDKLAFIESAFANLNIKESASKESTNISLNNLISVSKNYLNKNAIITVSAIQNGGTPEKLNQIFGDSSLINSCNSGDLTKCATLITNSVDYAKDIDKQIRDQNTGILIEKNLYYFNPVLTSYSSIGISVPAPNLLSTEAVNAQAKIYDELTTSQARIEFLNHFKSDSLPIQPDIKSYIAAQTKSLNNRINFIKSKAIDCFNAQAETCPAIVAQIENTFRNSTSTYSFDKAKYGQLNSSWYYVLNGNLTHLVPISFSNSFATRTTDNLTNNKIVQAYSSMENGVSYINQFVIPFKFLGVFDAKYTCLLASGENKFADTRNFICNDGGLITFNMQFTKTDSPL